MVPGVRRVFAAVIALVLGVTLAAAALRMARADWLYSRSVYAMTGWSAQQADPDFESWFAVREDLLDALRLEPRDPRALESLGLLHAGRGARAGRDRSGFQEQARDYLRRAAAARPTSPYTWANLALVKYRLGETDEEFRHALRQAAAYGPWEWQVEAAVADVGLATFPELNSADRHLVETMVANGMKRNPAEMLRIAQRRGGLAMACSTLDGETKGIDPGLAPQCDEMRSR